MADNSSQEISMEEFKFMANRAGLGMDQAELDHLKPIYELYLEYTAKVHSIDFGPEEMVVEFHPD
ncbi:MAG: hypothetical protein IH872_11120 [Chloroflexi bacterium]|nr:hypothetical protein [Chloroflexota bacterium]